jgi:hypothetical protein
MKFCLCPSCQKFCQMTPGCQYWTWYKTHRYVKLITSDTGISHSSHEFRINLFYLQGHWHGKTVSNKYMRWCLRPSIWTANIFKIFWSSFKKAKICKKIHLHNINRNFILCPPSIDNGDKPQINGKDLWHTAEYQEKPVCTFSPASPVGEQSGGEKLRELTVPVAVPSQLFSLRKRLATHRVLNSYAVTGNR